MSEKLPTPEASFAEKMAAIIEKFFPEDEEFLMGYGEDDLLGALYGMLIERGEDPDEVFAEYEITEEQNE